MINSNKNQYKNYITLSYNPKNINFYTKTIVITPKLIISSILKINTKLY